MHPRSAYLVSVQHHLPSIARADIPYTHTYTLISYHSSSLYYSPTVFIIIIILHHASYPSPTPPTSCPVSPPVCIFRTTWFHLPPVFRIYHPIHPIQPPTLNNLHNYLPISSLPLAHVQTRNTNPFHIISIPHLFIPSCTCTLAYTLPSHDNLPLLLMPHTHANFYIYLLVLSYSPFPVYQLVLLFPFVPTPPLQFLHSTLILSNPCVYVSFPLLQPPFLKNAPYFVVHH